MVKQKKGYFKVLIKMTDIYFLNEVIAQKIWEHKLSL